MRENKNMLVAKAITVLEERLHLVEEKANGHLRVNNVDFWATTGKWYDAKTKARGLGLKSFIEYLEK